MPIAAEETLPGAAAEKPAAAPEPRTTEAADELGARLVRLSLQLGSDGAAVSVQLSVVADAAT